MILRRTKKIIFSIVSTKLVRENRALSILWKCTFFHLGANTSKTPYMHILMEITELREMNSELHDINLKF